MITHLPNEDSEIKNEFDALFSFKDENEELKHDEFVLMSGYLAEIERLKNPLGINRKELAQKINVSAPYLTQVFRGDKPLNFFTIAKIQKVLNVKFEVKAIVLNDKSGFTFYETKSFTDIIRTVNKDYANTTLETVFVHSTPQTFDVTQMS